ncbi:type II toxin-antitoxin system death-on-curing family toxin [Tepidamorphus gemmatus]|uniref:type II toxin-antitoxin system death-on-curing family toxin n=1 Tax=Tepidamorphus gemmatus TaxID=747076 RepID=UPI001042F3C4|nr:Fic family protein [Tepidamorphus gemmatus]
MGEPFWLDAEQIIEQNQALVEETGEPFFLRNEGGLHSATVAPINYYHYSNERDLIVLACVLMRAIAQNHPFEQGNKRTAFVAAAAFLLINGIVFDPPDISTPVADLLLEFIDTHMDLPPFVDRFRQLVPDWQYGHAATDNTVPAEDYLAHLWFQISRDASDK